MKIEAYLVAWDDFLDNCLEIESQFKNIDIQFSVINSGSPISGWQNVGDIRYYRQFFYAIKNFNTQNDYLLFMCGDVSHSNWAAVIDRAVSVLSQYDDIYLYAPHFTNDPWNFDSTNLKISEQDKMLSISTNTNGIMFFMHKDLVCEMIRFFEYFESEIGWDGMVSGWALDIVHSAIAINKNKIILRDSKYIVNHPAGSSYNHDKATSESSIILTTFARFLPNAGHIVEKIYGRMSRDKNCSSIESFYGKDLDLIKSRNKIDFHIIHINDERIQNRIDIEAKVYGINHEIKCLNAKNPKEKLTFLNENSKFKISWEHFKDGEIGNFGSHYLSWKYVIENNLDRLLVFEDDAVIDDNFLDMYNLFIEHCPEDYDVFSMFVHENQFDRFTKSDQINEYIAKGYQDWSTLCYVVSNRGANTLVEYVESVGMDAPTDWFIFRNGHAGKFNVYTFVPKKAGSVKIDGRYPSQVQ